MSACSDKVIFIIGMALAVSAVAAPLRVVEDGAAKAEIVIPDRAHAAERFAGEELQNWIGHLTGAFVPVVEERNASADSTKLFVGTAFARTRFAKDIRAIGKTDGFAVRNADGNLYLFGSGPKGTLHAAYALLERNSDIIWARPDEKVGVIFGRTNEFVAVDADFRELPKTMAREWQWLFAGRYGGGQERLWAARNRQNIGGTADGPLASSFTMFGPGHKMCRYADAERNFAVHPEWFPEIKGKRTADGGQLCLTAYGMLPTYFANLTNDLARSFPGVLAAKLRIDYLNVTCADNHRICECANCTRPFVCENGKVVEPSDPAFRSAQYYTFLNRLARMLAKTHPHVKLGTYAYVITKYVPPFELEKNIVVQLCLTGLNERAPVCDPVSNAGCKRLVDAWTDVCPGLWIRSYVGWSGRNPRAVEYPYAESGRYAARRKYPVAMYSAEHPMDDRGASSPFATEIWDVSGLSAWVVSRLWWDPDQDVDALRRHYVVRTYREAAPEMQAYHDAVRDAFRADTLPCRYVVTNPAFMFKHYIVDAGLAPKLLNLLRAARNAARHPVSAELIDRQIAHFERNLKRAEGLGDFRLKVRPLAVGWDAADESAPFRLAAATYGSGEFGGQSAFRTTIKALHDDQALYIRYRCEAPDAMTMAEPNCGTGDPEDQPFGDDALELFVCRPDNGVFWQWIMDIGPGDGRGIVYDARIDDALWKGAWSREIARDGTAWYMTLRIPYSDLELDARPERLLFNGLRARSNPARQDKRGRPVRERASWTGAGVHDCGGFGVLEFVK